MYTGTVSYTHLLLLLLIDGFSTLLLWLCDAQAFQFLMGLIVLASLVLFSATVLFFYIKERQKQAFFRDFLTEPDAVSTERLLGAVSQQEQEQLHLLASVLQEKQSRIQEMEKSLRDYEDYVEGWAHEIKTPLSLLTMILEDVYKRQVKDGQVKVEQLLKYGEIVSCKVIRCV